MNQTQNPHPVIGHVKQNRDEGSQNPKIYPEIYEERRFSSLSLSPFMTFTINDGEGND